MAKSQDVRDMVKQAYGDLARQRSSCCAPKAPCCQAETESAPQGDLGVSCGNPVAFSRLKPGDVVVDLGSGAGRDVFLAAEKVGAAGRVIGVDMTPEMIELARRNAEDFHNRTGLSNTEFRQGHIEELPVPDASVDAVVSNCVINLSPDKPQVFREVYRVLKSGGEMVVSDIVLNRALPELLKNDDRLYSACIAGALLREDYLNAIRGAGFSAVEILSDILYSSEQACEDPITKECAGALKGAASSITVMAVKGE